MVSSRRNLSAAVVVVLLLVVVMAGKMAPVQANCYRLSGDFKGWCWYSDQCAKVCFSKNYEYVGGKCRGFPSRCYCISDTCPPAAAAAPESGGATARGPVMNE